MRKHMKLTLIAILSLVLLFTFSGSSFAADHNADDIRKPNYADEQIRKQIEGEFLEHYAAGLDARKDKFGVKDGSFKNVQLGSGIAYYVLSQNFYENGSQADIAQFQGYLFPAKLNGKAVATVYSEFTDGKWSIFKVNSIADVEDKANEAKKYVKAANSAKLIVDDRFGLVSLLAEGADSSQRFIIINDNKKLGLTASTQEVSPKDLFTKISSKKNQPNEKGGSSFSFTGDTSHGMNRTSIYWAIAAITFLALGIMVWLRKEKTNE